MLHPDMDIRRFAERLSEGGAEAVKWEIRKLQWIREERALQQQSEQPQSKPTQPENETA